MLITKLSTVKVINPESDRIILRDATGNYGDLIYTESEVTEGEYDVTSNDTGYGTINPTRDTVANFVVGKLRKIAGDVNVVLEGYSPIVTPLEYLAIAPEDGWYKFNFITVPIVASLTEILEGDSGYLDGLLVTKINSMGVAVEPDTLLDTKYSSPSVDVLFIARISLKLQEINTYLNVLRKGDQIANKPAITRAQSQFDAIRGYVTGGVYEFSRANKYPAQENIEYLNKYIIDIKYGL